MNLRSLFVTGVLAAFGPSLLAAQTGAVQGAVTGARTGDPVSGVQISVGETEIGGLSDSDGTFTIENVPVGVHTVTASSVGYGTVSREVRVQRGETVSLQIEVAREAVELGGITVTGRRGGYLPEETTIGTKVAGSLMEVPQSVSVITQERMVSQGVESQAEALRYTAGVQAESYGPDLVYDWTQIRGFQQYGQDLFRDGMQLRSASQATLRLNPFGAERVEILRGPASVLYGQSSAGGFVNYVSKTPTSQPFGEVTLQTGSYDRLQGNVDVTGPMSEGGDFLYRLTGLARSADAQVDFSQDDQIFVAPALTWEPGSSTTLTVLGDYQRDDAVRGTSFLPSSGTLEPNPNGTIPADRFDGVPGFNG
ncbi:MAG: TonB-dependent receptor plug domain-containing protein, partial [Gemmatimonadota bacterium]